MPQLDRFTVSLDTELLTAFDTYISRRGYQNRSEAVRDMIRDLLMINRPDNRQDQITALVSFVCEVKYADAAGRLRGQFLEASDLIRGALQAPLDAERDAYVIILGGLAERVQSATDRIQALRGITQVQMNVVSPTPLSTFETAMKT